MGETAVVSQENGKGRYVQAVRDLSRAFALAVPHEDAIRIRDDVAFLQAVQSVLSKRATVEARPEDELEHAVRQIISRAVASEGVIDIFAAAGLEKPDISILSDEFLSEVRGMERRNLAVELLQKLLKGELAARQRKNVVQARSFAKMLEQTLHRYQNRAVEAAQVIEELIQLARDLREASARGEQLGLSDDEVAFYDALETNDSAVQVLGDETLRDIARELVDTVRRNVTIDWTLRENVRANLRRLVKRILRKYGNRPTNRRTLRERCLNRRRLCPPVGLQRHRALLCSATQGPRWGSMSPFPRAACRASRGFGYPSTSSSRTGTAASTYKPDYHSIDDCEQCNFVLDLSGETIR